MTMAAEQTRTGIGHATRRTEGRAPAIAYDDVGEGRAIVFVHGGFGADRSHFSSQVEHLRHRYRVIALDLRGHGESEPSTGAYAVRDFASDIIAVCDAAGIREAVVAGHSVGGTAALQVAAWRPDLVRGVALLDAVLLFPAPVRETALTQIVPRLEGPDWREAARQYLEQRMLIASDPAGLKERVLGAADRASQDVVATFMRDLMSSDHADLVASSRRPLLYLHGVAPANLDHLRQLRADALVTQVIGSGHYVHLSMPDVVSATLDRFAEMTPGNQ